MTAEGKERERKVRREDNDEKYSLTSMVKLRKHSYFPAGFSRPLLVSDMLTVNCHGPLPAEHNQ